MKGYIYTMYKGADPGKGWDMTDPIYGTVPTLGACMPNIRRAVEIDDFIFSISGKVKDAKQYIVGGFAVEEKINMLLAHKRFPENRMQKKDDGNVSGNIIIDANGKHLDFDYHKNFERRIENYIIGKTPIVIEEEKHIEIARTETLYFLNTLFGKDEEQIHKVTSRWRKLDNSQVKDVIDFLKDIKKK